LLCDLSLREGASNILGEMGGGALIAKSKGVLLDEPMRF